MREGTTAVLIIGDYSYTVGNFKITDCETEYFCGSLELTIDDDVYPDIDPEESYNARLVVNGDALWYFPWLWFEKPDDLPNMKATTNGAIFCPFGLSDEDEIKYEAINSFLSIETGENISSTMWKQMLLVCSDWLLEHSVPQSKEFLTFANEIDDSEGENEDEDEEE